MGRRQACLDHLHSLLFVPGNDLSRVEEVGLRADAFVFDLETTVICEKKDAQRKLVNKQLSSLAVSTKPAFVRVNSMDSGRFVRDLDLMELLNLTGIVVPDWEHWPDLARLDTILRKAESEWAEGRSPLEVILIIESRRGVEHCRRLAPIDTRCRTIAVAFGANDYARDINMEVDWSSSQLDEPRKSVLHASKALSAPAFDTAYPLDSLEGLFEDAQRAKLLGFNGKFCKHPEQVDAVNEVFRNSTDPEKRVG